MVKIVGIPSNGPELSDNLSEHFGHGNFFIGVEIDQYLNFKKVFTIENNGHTGCMAPVMNMKQKNVEEMIVGGIGGRPFEGFTQVGIGLFKGVNGTISENIQLYLQGKLPALNKPLCAGGCHSEHEHEHHH